MKNIAFIGAGSMAEAIISGICRNHTADPADVSVLNKSDDERLVFLGDAYGVATTGSAREKLKEAELIVLAVKPKDAVTAMAEIAPFVPPHAAVLSVIAGIPISAIEAGLGCRAVARSMPNTSAAIGRSATGVAWNDHVTDEQKTAIRSLLASIGTVAEVTEDELHAVTALSGSGPAYIYYLAEALEDAARAAGLGQATARDLIIQTIEGAGAMLRSSGAEPADLRMDVTSPGGTTEAGIQGLREGGFQEAVSRCIRQAEQRSRELGAVPAVPPRLR
ncbi:pyrroline-5-carboxylate reductase [Sporosarcina sp. NCCP-2716]|uniref:pyrroline-5-carboxylate reductase n=1 Tax=Sporosarcina sp. NCCP-2716 TaxID=2943679 RepID=UPI00204228E4|nr:pyrroline-5-carboxylate reductase [Sporosarcina sp. NCCP-2716]GKV68151.1 pyrroline-5-carboxylate reductase [Sporosarcina sp. NCCP-2716]